MAYKLLGMAVWRGAKWFVRRKYGDRPKKIFAGTVVAAALLAGILTAAKRGGDSF